MTALIFMVFQIFADDCPDFSGQYVSDRGIYLSVTQKDCVELAFDRVESLGRPTVHHVYTPDGGRHPVGPYFYEMRWSDQKLVLDPYGKAEGGEMIGLRQTWYLEADGNLTESFSYPDDSVYDSVTYSRR